MTSLVEECLEESGCKAFINLGNTIQYRYPLEYMFKEMERLNLDPNRIINFLTPDFTRIEEKDYEKSIEEQILSEVALGAKGIKVFKSLGLRIRDRKNKLISINDPRNNPIWETAGELNIPILIHVSDPDNFSSRSFL